MRFINYIGGIGGKQKSNEFELMPIENNLK